MRLAWHAQNRRRAAFVLCTMLAAFAIFGLARARTGWASEEQARTARGAASSAPTPAVLRERTNSLAEVESGLVAIAEMLEPAIVSIRTTKNIEAPARVFDFDELFRGAPGMRDRLPTPRQLPRVFRAQGAGSGVIVAADGWILTNDHVVGDADKVIVKLHDGREFEGTVRRDYRSDLALVKIPATGLTVAEFGDSDKVRVGQFAIAFGSPFALDETMTLGIISARSRQKTISDGRDTRYYPSLLQTDASINPGNSGGALVDFNGTLVGINTAIISGSGGNIGIGFAVPTSIIASVKDQLIQYGEVRRGRIGVQISDLTPDLAKNLGIDQNQGAVIQRVEKDSPGDKAGLKAGDVAVALDGKPIRGSADLRNRVGLSQVGSTVTLTIIRDGAKKDVRIRLEKVPEKQEVAAIEEREMLEGASFSNNESGGIVVKEVQRGSPAWQAGLRERDVVQAVNRKSVKSVDEFEKALKDGGRQVALSVKRGDEDLFLIIQ